MPRRNLVHPRGLYFGPDTRTDTNLQGYTASAHQQPYQRWHPGLATLRLLAVGVALNQDINNSLLIFT